MLKRGFAFEFEVPDGWDAADGDGQVVARGPNGEEFIVSGSLVTGDGTPRDLAELRQALLDNAFESVQNAASVPELVITKPLTKDEEHSSYECWTLHSRTIDGDLFFGEAVVASDAAVMIATIEAPNEPRSVAFLQGFLRSVRKSAAH